MALGQSTLLHKLKKSKRCLIISIFICIACLLSLFGDWMQKSSLDFWTKSGSIVGSPCLSLGKTLCPVFTYYQPLSDFPHSLLLQKLEIWGYAFYAHGFCPVILNRTVAETRPNFNDIVRKFSQFPTANSAEYELNCYLRWVALAEQGGGLLIDYDILPMSNTRSSHMSELKRCQWNNLTSYSSLIPMVMHGNHSEIERWINYMLNFKLASNTSYKGRTHISDMKMARYSVNHTEGIFTMKPKLPFFHYSYYTLHIDLERINRTAVEIMTRSQHIYHFLHHDLYLPIPSSVSPYSIQIIRSLALCPDVVPTYDDLDFVCTNPNTWSEICHMMTINGFWSPNDLANGKCIWKTGRPFETRHEKILENAVPTKEPLLVGVLPRPEIYLWRLWTYEKSLDPTNTSLAVCDFHTWILYQSNSRMLDDLISSDNGQLNVETRVHRIINAMQSGQALLVTEDFLVRLQKSQGMDGIEKWISAHVGFFLTIADLTIDRTQEPVVHLDLKVFAKDQRFYSAIDEENDEWTHTWNEWRKTFLSNY